jgi:hypothetical protein
MVMIDTAPTLLARRVAPTGVHVRVVTVSIRTVEIVRGLPELSF